MHEIDRLKIELDKLSVQANNLDLNERMIRVSNLKLELRKEGLVLRKKDTIKMNHFLKGQCTFEDLVNQLQDILKCQDLSKKLKE